MATASLPSGKAAPGKRYSCANPTAPIAMRLSLPCLAFALTACAAHPPAPEAPDAWRADTFQSPPVGARLVLLPPQETQYEELRSGAELLHRQARGQLAQAGFVVVTLERDDYAKQWQQEAQHVGGVYQPDSGEFKNKEYLQAFNTLLRKNCEATKCALLIDARLVMRPAQVKAGVAEWDGRKQVVDAAPDGKTPGHAYGISVELSGITPDSTLAFKAYGGVALPEPYSAAELRNKTRKPLPWSEADIAEGLRIALKPLQEKPAVPARRKVE
jgi:hypothetical protein